MKKTKLVIEYDFDFEVFGIRSTAKGYKLAWQINQLLHVNLVKQEDLITGFKGGVEKSFSYYSYETQNNRLKLLKNRPVEEESSAYYLMPEYPHLDYVLLSKMVEFDQQSTLTDILRNLSGVELIVHIELQHLKSKTNFVF